MMQGFDFLFLNAERITPTGTDAQKNETGASPIPVENDSSGVSDTETPSKETPQEDVNANAPEPEQTDDPGISESGSDQSGVPETSVPEEVSQPSQAGPSQEEIPANETELAPGNAPRQEPDEEQVLLSGNQGFQETQLSVIAPFSQGVSPILPFFSGVLVALLLGGLALWLFRRKAKRGHIPVRSFSTGTIETAHLHETGARDSQQDAFCITGEDFPEHGVLAAVSDGMGGLVNSGQVSSALTDALLEAYAPSEEVAPVRQLHVLFQQALRRVEDCLKESVAQSGSTLAVCLIKDRTLSWLSVGDSRIYLWRGGGLIQLNRDHDFHHDLTLLAMQGDMELSEADSDPRRESLTSYIGRDFPRKVEWNPEPVQLMAGDKVLLVSDGVYRALSQEEMARCLANSPQEAANKIRTEIEKKSFPQQDNYTAVVLSVR